MIKLCIVDDHRVLVTGLVGLFSSSNNIQIVGTAYNAKECRLMLSQQQPDVILLDINLPDASGTDLCKEIKIKYPAVKIIALTSYSEYTVIRQMLENGASGYVLKNAMPDEIILGVETVAEGNQFLCDEVDMLMNSRSKLQIWLTPREKELLGNIVNGFTNNEIADKMFLGIETVNSYRKNLLCKLGARNTAKLVKMAIEEKLI
ncbi:MAG: response regulator transcription factor [Paludibacter sp.]